MAGETPKGSGGSGGLSLYANLLEPEANAPGSISRAPLVSQEALDAVKEQEAAKKPLDGALRFQPHQQIRRPQPKTQKPKASFLKVPPSTGSAASTGSAGNSVAAAAAATPAAPPVAAKSTLADWAATEQDEYMYGTGEKRPRGGRKKKKKRFEAAPLETDWDEIYDPSRPTNVDEYLRSDERIREVQEWKALLYRHRRRDDERADSWDSEEDDNRPVNNQFAPPPSYSFAPPPPSPPRASVPEAATGDDAYTRRLALSQGQNPPPPHSATPPPPPPPPPPPQPDAAATIAREPVRYARPEPPPPAPDADAMDEDEPDEAAPPPENAEEQPRTNRPGQKGFAARLMSKYGWSRGQGLGAEGSGIVAPLRVQVEKRRKRPDSEGGGWADPANRARIIGARTGAGTSSEDSGGRFGPMSSVVVLRDMLDGLPDLQAEMEGGLGQEIGEECGDQYGRVERLHIDVAGRRVYIKFTDQVSALRAVNALDGRVFAGNTIRPQFYDPDKFESRVYE
ncbi:hypothetical protein GGR56DRAFT_683778 [Xylariaceae sp. FL0804]|nr:hypothetical protein GGR56DRAFT_683778 [Xylariaceae sp. FL0804]